MRLGLCFIKQSLSKFPSQCPRMFGPPDIGLLDPFIILTMSLSKFQVFLIHSGSVQLGDLTLMGWPVPFLLIGSCLNLHFPFFPRTLPDPIDSKFESILDSRRCPTLLPVLDLPVFTLASFMGMIDGSFLLQIATQ